MINWLDSMNQSFEYYEVDPNTWKDVKKLTNIKSCKINRDDSADSLGSATLTIINNVGECYIRIYLVCNQNGVSYRFPLGTFIGQTPSSSFDGKVATVSMDAYTPLIELKEKLVPIGYSLLKDDNIMNEVYRITRENCRAPVIKTESTELLKDNFIANSDDNWLKFLIDLMGQANYSFSLDEEGQILFEPIKKTEELRPVWTYNDDNSSILLPEIELDHDIYNIPNVVEIVCSTPEGLKYSRKVNDDPNSITSTVSRGREITYRETDPAIGKYPTQEQIDEYAETLLKNLSSLEYKVSYSHGYCPVRVGDCVRLNYSKAGLENITAKVISQKIDCSTGCSVSETAVFTKKLYK